jgi:ATP-dependent DNA ligase
VDRRLGGAPAHALARVALRWRGGQRAATVGIRVAPDHTAAAPPAGSPAGEGWAYEPKWDGFRAIAFVDGDETYLQSRNGKALSRYFPELAFPHGRYVLDGEIVASSFDTLGQRIHPAASRIARLAEETPARFVAFDVLALNDDALIERPYEERRSILETIEGLQLTPVARTAQDAQRWLQEEEGVIAKELAAPYLPGERRGMLKIKRVRTIDAVVIGWRPGKEEGTVGAIILGLYDDDGHLREVGHCSGFTKKKKRELVAELAPYETGQRGSGDPSRWTQGRDLEWVQLRPELVVEVSFDHVSDGRIRHGTTVMRWRDDKAPRECSYRQLAQ